MVWLTTLLELFRLVPKLMALSQKLSAFIKDKNIEAWIDDLSETIDFTSAAKTPEEKRQAARKLVDLVRRL